MKKISALIIALAVAFTLIGCNVAPNVPVTPYTTGGTYSNRVTMPYRLPGTGNYNNRVGTGTYRNRVSTMPRTGTYNNRVGNMPYGNRTGTYKSNMPLTKFGVNPADKVLLPQAGTR